jgi:hypothetical protein
MTPNKDQKALGELVREIAAVLGLMVTIFAVLEIFLPTSFAQPLGALVSGLVLTALLACVGKWDWGTMLITWLAVGIGLIILYLIVSRPATVMGAVVDSSDSPVVGLTLVLTDSYGVDHRAVTDESGAFEIKNVPEGKFTVLANDELLISRQVPSGWKRILEPVVDVGIPVHKPSLTSIATPTNTPTPTLTPTPTPTPTTTPTNTPTLTPPPAMPHAVVINPVNLRSGPGTVYDIIGTLSPGQILTVTGRIADTTWLQVNTDQMQEGWVVNRADLVTLNLPTEQIPIVPTPPPPACQITEPADGDENLGYDNEVRVTCSDVPDSLHIWILVLSHHDASYYPQPGPIGSGSGDYEGKAYLGTKTEGAGNRFDIIVTLADEAANTKLQSDAANHIGWPDLPDGVAERARITVRRGPSIPRCWITQPAGEDENLGYANEVRVTCSDVPDSLYVWILVYSHHDFRYYPQPGPIGTDSGDYVGIAYLGTETEGAGHRFDIIVALADATVSEDLQLPDGVEEKDRITVRRGQGCLITEPKDGDQDLGWENDVRAQCSGVPTSLYVWVLVYSHYDSHYYPQVKPMKKVNGDYEGKAYLGLEGTGEDRGIGHEYDIIIALADATMSGRLQEYARSHSGYEFTLPDGVEEKDRITVKRGH